MGSNQNKHHVTLQSHRPEFFEQFAIELGLQLRKEMKKFAQVKFTQMGHGKYLELMQVIPFSSWVIDLQIRGQISKILFILDKRFASDVIAHIGSMELWAQTLILSLKNTSKGWDEIKKVDLKPYPYTSQVNLYSEQTLMMDLGYEINIRGVPYPFHLYASQKAVDHYLSQSALHQKMQQKKKETKKNSAAPLKKISY